ncbi:MAG: hypothetical protein LBK29_04315 [Oscillospiraceae bacterium]|jgi:hypothetical protein|nr:hypothetical protein [Oscillospiraceae bacterium]
MNINSKRYIALISIIATFLNPKPVSFVAPEVSSAFGVNKSIDMLEPYDAPKTKEVAFRTLKGFSDGLTEIQPELFSFQYDDFVDRLPCYAGEFQNLRARLSANISPTNIISDLLAAAQGGAAQRQGGWMSPGYFSTSLVETVKESKSGESIIVEDTDDNFDTYVKDLREDPFILLSSNLEGTESISDSLWNNSIKNMPKKVVLVQRLTRNNPKRYRFFAESTAGVKYAIFATYLHELFEHNASKGLSPKDFFSPIDNFHLSYYLRDKFEDVPRISNDNEEGGLLTRFFGINFGNLFNFSAEKYEVEPINVAYEIFMQTSEGIEKFTYIAGKWTSRAALATVSLGVPVFLWVLFKKLSKAIVKSIFGLNDIVNEKILTSINKFSNNPQKLRALIIEEMQKKIVGRKQIIEELATLLSGIIFFNKNTNLPNSPKGLLISLSGPPGTGKSMFSSFISLCVTGGVIDGSLSLNASVMCDMNFPTYFREGSIPHKKVTNAGGKVTILLDEYDKLVIEKRKEVENVMRDITDYGYMTVKAKKDGDGYKKLDMTGSVIIICSNALPKCWNIASKNKHSKNIGMTDIGNISKSFTDRCAKFVLFPFTKKEFKIMISNNFNELKKILEKHRCCVTWGDHIVEDIATNAVRRNEGARYVGRIMLSLGGELSKIKKLAPANGKSFLNLFKRKQKSYIEIKFDKEKDTVFFEEYIPNLE